ncbi:MAG TPA: sulfate/molybdate ABC transporter ATP-binding protein [Kofleriaceae bacterium]|nr:sulfate/molybdate ABC transporter ATP-binding protein [Kofleriaceae bacterium]
MGIVLDRVSKTFGAWSAVRDVSLDVKDGELLALLGPSGSGKTSLLRLIAGLEDPDPGAGSIRFDDRAPSGDLRERRVGFVFQHYALFHHMTVFDNIAFGPSVRSKKLRPSKQAIAVRVNELLRLVQLDGMADRFPGQLSGGQRQRVALARALAVEPRVLLLDEPFGALDARVRRELRAWLRRLHDNLGITSVFVTHDQDEALEVADRVVVMNAGRIEQVGSPDQVFHQPASEFVVSFLGDAIRFQGVVRGRSLDLHGVAFDRPPEAPAGAAEGAAARAFVRPHEIDLLHAPNGRPSFPAVISRIHSAGPQVRVELAPVGGGVALAAMLPGDLGLTLEVGATVHVVPRRFQVFVDAQTPG